MREQHEINYLKDLVNINLANMLCSNTGFELQAKMELEHENIKPQIRPRTTALSSVAAAPSHIIQLKSG